MESNLCRYILDQMSLNCVNNKVTDFLSHSIDSLPLQLAPFFPNKSNNSSKHLFDRTLEPDIVPHLYLSDMLCHDKSNKSRLVQLPTFERGTYRVKSVIQRASWWYGCLKSINKSYCLKISMLIIYDSHINTSDTIHTCLRLYKLLS
jgi:hypothetical protein